MYFGLNAGSKSRFMDNVRITTFLFSLVSLYTIIKKVLGPLAFLSCFTAAQLDTGIRSYASQVFGFNSRAQYPAQEYCVFL